MRKRWAIRAARIGAMGILAIGIFGFVVMNLWNWLAPPVFGLHTITFWQALGVLILSRILFGGFNGRPGPGRHWRGRLNERLQQMTPEERERFCHGMSGPGGRSSAVGEGSRQQGRA